MNKIALFKFHICFFKRKNAKFQLSIAKINPARLRKENDMRNER